MPGQQGDSDRTTVLVGGVRTPMGRLLGSLTPLSAPMLAGRAIAGALERTGVSPDLVEYVILGQVLPAGCGQAPYRQAALEAGIGYDVPTTGVNKVCLSGMEAIVQADAMIRAGDLDVVVAGGMESMTNAPHLLPGSRSGFAYGSTELVDHMAFDGLHDAVTDQSMGLLTEAANHGDQFVSREEQDDFASRSHHLAAQAWERGRFDDEVIEVTIPRRRGEPEPFRRDEGIRAGTTAEALAALRPAFSREGTVTAGNASQISDGACALVLMSAARARELDLRPLATIGAHGLVAGPDTTLQHQPAVAIAKACAREGISVSDLDLVEINEAFAAVAVASARQLGIGWDQVNVNGGAIALGHPLGMSGARVVLTLALELARRGGGVGAAALCGGGGQGEALVVRTPA
ncbi:MAG: acetyl-CoA C-acetyltransferase [Actinomycetales bacterium]